MFTLRQLEYIVAIAETGLFVEAAKRCAVSQPALSKQVRAVEDALGVELFERARPRVLVTDAGAELVRRARRLLADADALVDAARDRQTTVRLGVIPTIAPYGLPGLLTKLRRRFPQVNYAIRELQTETLLEELRSGGIDLGLLARPFDESGLAGPDLIFEPFVLVAPADHPLGRKRAVTPAEIAGESLILMEDGHCLRDQAVEVCAAAGLPPATSVEAASVSTLTRMVESGLGPTLLPASALRAEVRPGQGIVARSFGTKPPGRTLTLQWRATAPNSVWFAELGEVLREHYLEMNETIPTIGGPKPRIRAARPE